MSAADPPPRAHVVVAGAGGLGCPASWALADAGVARITVLDPDRIEPSNLPRQVLFGPEDVGRPKAEVAAERLARPGVEVRGLRVRLDDANADAVLADADLLLDATDGARAKDWLNALAVRRGLPLVHAAALRSEGRLLDVPPGGRPCLACLFGRLEEEGGTCADLGVWSGVVGATGFLAAAAVLRRLARPRGPASSEGYLVLDLETGRGVTLSAAAAASCPVCGADAPRSPEPYPADASACAPAPAPPAGEAPGVLDLVGEVCPMNLLRARRAVEALPAGARLEIRLGAEGRDSVPEGLRALGHVLLASEPWGDGRRLLVRARGGGSADEGLARDVLLRYARHVVLPEFGEEGQRRVMSARVLLGGAGPAHEAARVYLAAAGVGALVAPDAPAGREGGFDVAAEAFDGRARPMPALPGSTPRYAVGAAAGGAGRILRLPPGAPAPPRAPLGPAAARALGALLADTVLRHLVLGRHPLPGFVVSAEGRIGTTDEADR